MSGLKGFRIARGEPDIRGWEVRTLNGRDVGEVDDLLVDPESGEVVFLDVAMNITDRHIELAIRSAQLDREKKHVIVDSGDVDALQRPAPTYESAAIDERDGIDAVEGVDGVGDIDAAGERTEPRRLLE
jgi:sporulation protein YlmC with PRC-barrel domain